MLPAIRRANKRWKREQKRKQLSKLHLAKERRAIAQIKSKEVLTSLPDLDTIEE